MASYASVTVALLAGGCSFTAPVQVDAHVGGDVSSEGDSMGCFGTGASFTICLPDLPTTPYAVSSPTTFDTGTDCTFTLTPPGGELVCVRAATTIMISSQLTVVGTRPLVLVATMALQVTGAGTIDVASHRGGTLGGGTQSSGCTTSTPGAPLTTGGAGGGGGSFGTDGGDGGNGDGGNAARGQAGVATPRPAFLRGGCRGGNGGAGGPGATGGLGGAGGGAVYLLSGGTMTIAGVINASGAGATASPKPTTLNGGGAGGGGSGGMIALHAKTSLTVAGAKIFANGGGGAEGGDKPSDPDPGHDPLVTTPTVGGARGAGQAGAGGDGGNGAGGLTTADPGLQGNEGGGGGGGGVGVIEVLSGQPLTGATVSPPPSL